MTHRGTILAIALVASGLALQGCGGIGSGGSGGSGFGSGGGGGARMAPPRSQTAEDDAYFGDELTAMTTARRPGERRETLWNLFGAADDPNVTVEVNKYLWNAALDVLNFLPIESADPFSGVIVTGYGTPPGGGRAYRATIYVQDPALDARALKLALATRSGPTAAHPRRQALIRLGRAAGLDPSRKGGITLRVAQDPRTFHVAL